MSKRIGLTGICILVVLTLNAQSALSLISVDRTSVPLSTLLEDVTLQSGMHFAFNPRVIDADEQLSFTCDRLELSKALDQLCAKAFLNYEIVEGQIVLTPMDASQLPVYMLTGHIYDSSSAEVLISATVAIDYGTSGTTSNEFGYYALPLRRGKHTISFAYLGYRQIDVEIDIRRNVIHNVSLPRTASMLPEIEIRSVSQGASHTTLHKEVITPEKIKLLPELGGESGLVKSLEQLNGIKQHSDVSAFFYVRGGERDQNVIYIDDAPIYNPSHLLGLSSMVLPDFVQQINVYKSDMPASLGDRLASIVSVRTREGDLNQFRMSGAINPFVNRLSVEIPLRKERSSLFLSYRRSRFEILYKKSNPNVDFYFQDFHLKWNYRANDRNRFFITMIASNDNFTSASNEVSSILWGNFAATFRWNHIFSPRVFSNTTVYTGNYAYILNLAPTLWKSELGTLSLKSDFTHYISRNVTSRFGLEIQGLFTTPGQITLESNTSFLPDIRRNYGRKSVLYYQSEMQLSEKLKLNAGLRLIRWENTGPAVYFEYNEEHMPVERIETPEAVYNTYASADPRLSIEYAPSYDRVFRLSYGIYHQYLQLISNSISPYTAMEIWLTASPNIRPQRSHQWSFDFGRRWGDNGQFGISAYYKSSDRQIDLDGHATIYLNEHLEGALRFGTSEAYGIECRLQRTFGRLDGTFAYTWSRVFRTTPELNAGERYPALQDRPHDLSLVAIYRLSKRLSVTGFWKSSTGSPFTSPVSYYEYNGQTVPVYGARNNDRLPPYHRLDLSLHWKLNRDTERRYQHSLTFSVYNIIGHKNIYAVKFNKLFDEELFPETPANVLAPNTLSPSRTELVQLFPSLTYKFGF